MTRFVALFTARQAGDLRVPRLSAGAARRWSTAGRHAERFHVRGFNEQGTTTTPFDMVVLNEMSRYHLAIGALRWTQRYADRAPALVEKCRAAIESAVAYSREHFEDPAHIRDWHL